MRIHYYIIVTTLLISCSQRPEKPMYRLFGKIEGLENAVIYLEGAGPKDTLIVEKGEFLFSGSVRKPIIGFIEIEGIGKSREFYIENSDIEVLGHIDSLDSFKVYGSKTEDEMIAYQTILEVFEKEYAEIGREYETADSDRKAQLEQDYEQTELRQVAAQKQFIKQNPTSYLCLEIISEIDWSFNSASEYDEYLGILDSSLLELDEAKYIIDIVERMRLVEIGVKAPDFVIDDINGDPIRLSDLYTNSELLLVDFWASNCGPCRIENANIRKAYELYHDKGLEILGVSTDTRKEHWIQAIDKDGLIWKNVCSLEKWGDNEVVEKYALRQVSQNYLLDKNGIIIAKDLRGEDLINQLGELLN
jgi:peroxiredoxin